VATGVQTAGRKPRTVAQSTACIMPHLPSDVVHEAMVSEHSSEVLNLVNHSVLQPCSERVVDANLAHDCINIAFADIAAS
jgi:hypothetical protein